MEERLKELRKTLGLNQAEFAERINLGQSTWGMIEVGKRSLNDRHILLICSIFNVNEQWIRTGEGDMFKQIPEEDEVAAYVSELLEDDGANPLYTIIKEIMHTYNELDPKSQDVLKESCNKLLENLSKRKEG